jgi:hypothetical protein
VLQMRTVYLFVTFVTLNIAIVLKVRYYFNRM